MTEINHIFLLVQAVQKWCARLFFANARLATGADDQATVTRRLKKRRGGLAMEKSKERLTVTAWRVTGLKCQTHENTSGHLIPEAVAIDK